MSSANAILKLQQDYDERNANDIEFIHLFLSKILRLKQLLIGLTFIVGDLQEEQYG